ncbi:MAG: LON peptidase substrate-binding domain-containing protein, partial [Pseudomonas sp.]
MTLPLFPLNTVLFPGCFLDLQIFEARYLDMIGRCMKQGGGFGVVCILEGSEVGLAPEGYALVGCEARITDFQQQDNGLLGIRVEGGRRFRVRDAGVQKDQLLVAEVQWLHEHPEQPLEEEDADLLALLHALAEHPMVASLDMGTHADGQQALGNQLAYL